MFWYHATALLMLFNVAFGFPRGKTTEKPEIPLMANPLPPKNRKPPTHISEFTDPKTGLNPFLDLEEGPTSVGRNVMEDERSEDDAPYFDFDDLVEGDAPNRRWDIEDPKESVDKVPVRWPNIEFKDEIEIPAVTTPLVLPNPPTTVELFIATSTENVKIQKDNSDQEIRHIKGEKESFVVSQSTVIYASATIAAVATLILLVGACWWRRKLKTPQSTTTMENGEVRS